eukprot:365592-Chlamydomonas_euryale.AAC.7
MHHEHLWRAHRPAVVRREEAVAKVLTARARGEGPGPLLCQHISQACSWRSDCAAGPDALQFHIIWPDLWQPRSLEWRVLHPGVDTLHGGLSWRAGRKPGLAHAAGLRGGRQAGSCADLGTDIHVLQCTKAHRSSKHGSNHANFVALPRRASDLCRLGRAQRNAAWMRPPGGHERFGCIDDLCNACWPMTFLRQPGWIFSVYAHMPLLQPLGLRNRQLHTLNRKHTHVAGALRLRGRLKIEATGKARSSGRGSKGVHAKAPRHAAAKECMPKLGGRAPPRAGR